jgi:HAD superfamily hydrolase (TIGR01509 family)
MKLKPKAILFDMDGVLVDSLDAWLISLNSALKRYHHKQITREEFIEKYWGHDLYDNLDRMGLSHEIGDFCNSIYSEHVHAIKIYPDTRDTLKRLKDYKKGIITNTPRDCTMQILKQFDIEQYFDSVITSDDVDKAKPDPEIVLKACAALGVKPKDSIMVGDTESDVQAGKAAGCTVIGIQIQADYTIERLSQLREMLNQ